MRAALLLLVPLAAACPPGGGDTGNPGFTPPTATTKANEKLGGIWTELGDADWSCLGTPTADRPSVQQITLSGTVHDFQTGDPVGNADVTAFGGSMLHGNAGTALTTGAGGTAGQYSMTLAQLSAGETRYGFRLEARDFVRTYSLGHYLDPAVAAQSRNLVAWSASTLNALPAFNGATWDITDALVIGTIHDCAGHFVSNAIATVSDRAGTASHLDGASSFYFSALSTSLPVRHTDAAATRGDGLFLVMDLPAQDSPAFIQVWGFPSAADLAAGQLVLLAELAAPMEATTATTADLEPRRSP